jgi:hypothetical protein
MIKGLRKGGKGDRVDSGSKFGMTGKGEAFSRTGKMEAQFKSQQYQIVKVRFIFWVVYR